jgi:hypothetical protein
VGRNALQRGRRILGVPIPEKIDFGGIGKEIGGLGQQLGEAGKQFGKLAGEVQSFRQKAEQIGKALS